MDAYKRKRIESNEYIPEGDLNASAIDNYLAQRAEIIEAAYKFIQFEKEHAEEDKKQKENEKKMKMEKRAMKKKMKQQKSAQVEQGGLAACEKLNKQPKQNQTIVSIPATSCRHQQSSGLFNLEAQKNDVNIYYNHYLPVDELFDLFDVNNACKRENRKFMFNATSYYDLEAIMENAIITKKHLIDIDLSNYDEIRTCCKGRNICKKCWKYAALACKILDKELKEHWQYKHIVWIYSERRGIFGWICDGKAREKYVKERTKVTQFFSGVESRNSKKRIKFRGPLDHPSICDNFVLCFKFFIEICIKKQDLLNDMKNILYFLEQVPVAFRKDLLTGFKSYKTSLQRWNFFLLYYDRQMNNNVNNGGFVAECKYLVEEIVIQYTFPKLAGPISVLQNHVLKCPFTFHPKTGKIALVINPEQVGLFNPDEAPRVDEIVEQYQNGYGSSGQCQFKKSVEHFKNLLIQVKKNKEQQQQQ